MRLLVGVMSLAQFACTRGAASEGAPPPARQLFQPTAETQPWR